MDTKKLMKKLNAANEHLKKFSHVNKKALDQYVSFSDQRETILERKEEIDAAQTAIKELIDGLDQQKDEVGDVVVCGMRYQIPGYLYVPCGAGCWYVYGTSIVFGPGGVFAACMWYHALCGMWYCGVRYMVLRCVVLWYIVSL